jgi:hypothetical protein
MGKKYVEKDKKPKRDKKIILSVTFYKKQRNRLKNQISLNNGLFSTLKSSANFRFNHVNRHMRESANKSHCRKYLTNYLWLITLSKNQS